VIDDLVCDITDHTTPKDYANLGHIMSSTLTVAGAILVCGVCSCWAGSEASLNLCGHQAVRVGGLLDPKSFLRRQFERRVGKHFGNNKEAWDQLYG